MEGINQWKLRESLPPPPIRNVFHDPAGGNHPAGNNARPIKGAQRARDVLGEGAARHLQPVLRTVTRRRFARPNENAAADNAAAAVSAIFARRTPSANAETLDGGRRGS